MAKWLRGLKLTRIDLVDRGANPGATVELFKRDDDKESDVTQQELEARVAQLETENADLQKRVEELTPAPADEPTDPIAKADPAVRELIAKAEEKARAAEERVAKLQEERETTEYVTKAAEMAHMGEAGTFGPVLRKIAKALTTEEFTEFEQRLRSAEEVIKQADILKEQGSDGEAETDGYERIRKDALAKHPDLPPHQAVKAHLATPEGAKAYREYVAAQKGQ